MSLQKEAEANIGLEQTPNEKPALASCLPDIGSHSHLQPCSLHRLTVVDSDLLCISSRSQQLTVLRILSQSEERQSRVKLSLHLLITIFPRSDIPRPIFWAARFKRISPRQRRLSFLNKYNCGPGGVPVRRSIFITASGTYRDYQCNVVIHTEHNNSYSIPGAEQD